MRITPENITKLDDDNEENIRMLQSYGKLEEFCQRPDSVEFKIAEGFDGKAVTTFELLKLCQDIAGPVYKYIGKCNTDKNMFHLILKK